MEDCRCLMDKSSDTKFFNVSTDDDPGKRVVCRIKKVDVNLCSPLNTLPNTEGNCSAEKSFDLSLGGNTS